MFAHKILSKVFFATAAATVITLTISSGWAADKGQDIHSSPPANFKKVSSLVKLPDYLPGMGTLYVDPSTYMCCVCSHIYDEALGEPEAGIAPGTRWEDIPENWACPECGAVKADFEEMA